MDRDCVARFDLGRLFVAIDRERQRQDLSWADLARRVGVSASTIRRFESADDAEADGVLTLIAWLGTIPESYIATGRVHGRKLPTLDNGFVRVDMARLPSRHGHKKSGTRTTIQRLTGAAQESRQPIAELVRHTVI